MRSFLLCAALLSVSPLTVNAQSVGSGGAVSVAGLTAPVTLTRDSAGIVHIEAQNEHDLFFAQGYSAARDRLFQLELWRRQATGTMAEALGPRWVERDRAARLMQYRGDMAAELAHYHPRGGAIIQAFVDGVNAWVQRVQSDPSLLPPDLAALGITPGAWTPSVVVSRHNALASNASDEGNVARAVRAMGAEAVKRRRLYQPANVQLVLDSLVAQVVSDATDARILAAYSGSRNAPTFRANELAASWRKPSAAPTDSTDGREADRWESNSWVISGRKPRVVGPLWPTTRTAASRCHRCGTWCTSKRRGGM
jgi:penicillin G amidase